MTVRELEALLKDVYDDDADVVVKDDADTEGTSSNVVQARYEKKFKQLVKDENEETKAEYCERVVLVI